MSKSIDFLEQGTKLSGFSSAGPFHCEDCIHLKGNICVHPIVALDPELKNRKKKGGIEILDDEKECCRYVSQPAEPDDDGDDAPEPLRKVLK